MIVRRSPVRFALMASILSACLQASIHAQGVATPTYPGTAPRSEPFVGAAGQGVPSSPSSPYLSPATKAIIGGGVARPLQFPTQDGAQSGMPSGANPPGQALVPNAVGYHAGGQVPGAAAMPPMAPAPSAEGAVTSQDFLKLMEEANAARGIGVYGGDFPGAKKIPQASSAQPAFQKTMIPPRPVAVVPTPAVVPNAMVDASNPAVLESDASKPFLPPPIQIGPPPTPLPQSNLPSVSAEPFAPSPQQQGPATVVPQPIATQGAVPEWSASQPIAPQTNTPVSPGMLIPRTPSQAQVSNPAYPGQPSSTVASNPAMANPSLPSFTDPSFGSNIAPTAMPQPYTPQTSVHSVVPNLNWPNPNAPSPNAPSPNAMLPIEQAAGSPVPKAPPAASQKTANRHRVIGGYESVWMERTGDQSMSYSQGSTLGSFGTDQAGLYTIGYLMDPMESLEFRFLGTFHWDRDHSSTGPVNSTLISSDPNWLQNFNGATLHEQHHQAKLRSYEFNKRLITDDLGNSYYGLNIIDYSEDYRFESLAPGGTATMGIGTANILAGMHAGMELWRPFSQRFSLGGQGACGLYANFADANWTANSGNGLTLNVASDDWHLAFKLGIAAKARYQFNSACSAFGGYDWTYLGGLATAENQPTHSLSSQPSFGMTTNAGFLLQSASCGIEFRY